MISNLENKTKTTHKTYIWNYHNEIFVVNYFTYFAQGQGVASAMFSSSDADIIPLSPMMGLSSNDQGVAKDSTSSDVSGPAILLW